MLSDRGGFPSGAVAMPHYLFPVSISVPATLCVEAKSKAHARQLAEDFADGGGRGNGACFVDDPQLSNWSGLVLQDAEPEKED